MYSLIGALSDTFSRQDAISHGQLVDVSEPARRLGYGCQVAVTAALWNEYIATSPGLFVEAQQKRLREILSLLHFSCSSPSHDHCLLWSKADGLSSNRAMLRRHR